MIFLIFTGGIRTQADRPNTIGNLGASHSRAPETDAEQRTRIISRRKEKHHQRNTSFEMPPCKSAATSRHTQQTSTSTIPLRKTTLRNTSFATQVAGWTKQGFGQVGAEASDRDKMMLRGKT